MSPACAVELVWAEQLGQDGFSTVSVPFPLPGSERKPQAGRAGCAPPPATVSIHEDAFGASTPGLSVDGQQKGHRWTEVPFALAVAWGRKLLLLLQ